jgi:ferredoxin-NADP reductase/ferredoxin
MTRGRSERSTVQERSEAGTTSADESAGAADPSENIPDTPLTQRIRDLEMPWNRVLSATTGPAGAAVALNPWHPQEFLAECVGIVPEAGGMKTFVFRRVDGAPLAFRPGQYLRIAFPVDGPDADPVDRSYSLSSAPTQPWTFDITVKREEDGRVSGWVHDNVRPGTVLEMLGPVGAFHLPDAERRPRYLLLAAGSGITPIMSMIRTIHTLPGYADIVVLYHGTAPGTFAFSRELEYLTSIDSRITVFYSLGDRSVEGTWEGMVGRLTTSMIDDVAPDANGRHVYACGPQGYLDAATQLLLDVGVDDTAIHVEYFTGTSDVRLEYKEEVALASELAEEYAEAVQDYHDTQTAALDVFVPAPEAADANASEATDSKAGMSPAVGETQEVQRTSDAASIPDAASATDAASSADFQTVGEGPLTMSFMRSRLNVRIGTDERILQVAQQAGVRIGANCQEGMCGSCKSVKLSGEVEMNHQGGIRQREIDAGKFLPCCSTATTDLVIDA